MSETLCDICGKELSVRNSLQYIEGWVRVHRAQGGANTVNVEKRHERFVHQSCLELKDMGLLNQQTLL